MRLVLLPFSEYTKNALSLLRKGVLLTSFVLLLLDVEVVAGVDQVAVGDLGVPGDDLGDLYLELISDLAQGIALGDLVYDITLLGGQGLVAACYFIHFFQGQLDGFFVFAFRHFVFLLHSIILDGPFCLEQCVSRS